MNGSLSRLGQHSSSNSSGKNEGLAFSLARSNDGGFLAGENITGLIFEYFTLCKAANCMTQAFIW